MEMIERIYTRLKEAGITIYLPGQHQGKCIEPYAVVRNGGIYPRTKTTGIRVTIVSCFAPLGRATDLLMLADEVRAAMLPLRRDIRLSGNESEQTINVQFEAHELAIEFAALCAI